MDDMRPAQTALFALLVRIVRDGAMTGADRRTIARIYGPGGMTLGEVDETFRAFLRATWGDVIDDELVSPAEQALLASLRRGLGLGDTPLSRVA